MALIVSSFYVIDAHMQRDGSRYARERFVLDDGRVVKSLPYKLTAKDDPEAILQRHAEALEADLARAEAETAERDALRAKIEIAIDDGVKAGKLTAEEAAKFGYQIDGGKATRG